MDLFFLLCSKSTNFFNREKLFGINQFVYLNFINIMIKTATDFFKELRKKFPFEPTISQEIMLSKLSDFIFNKNNDGLFLMKGYAGTGKTTAISAVVNNLWKTGKKSVLLAPTGRAAKVISVYSGRQALTIHKKIYHPRKNKFGAIEFVRQPNKHTNTFFFVDEASMIAEAQSSSKLFDNGSLLDDLITFVYSGVHCKLILIGDTAQLPPVKLAISPAMDVSNLKLKYQKDITEIQLNEVMRQHEDSGILINATALRKEIASNSNLEFRFNVGYSDITLLMDGYEIEDAIHAAYANKGVEDTAFIVRSNKRANQYNNQIRIKIRGQENEISTGDFVMIVRNNYFWLHESSDAGFIANGDICEIMRIYRVVDLYGFRFAEVNIRMIDYPKQRPFDTVVLLDTLHSETPSLSYNDSNKLYQEVAKDYAHEKTKYKQLLGIKKNKYFNALQIKFSYAVTCHKSQGGQWSTVFIEQPYLPEGQSVEYLRWLYTALTRAKEKVYLIGFKNSYFIAD